jgi:RNA polymerase sigma-70 factor (ECF subfamily)
VPPSSDPELLNRIEQAMLSLPPKTREIFIAHRVHGLSYQQIADCTGLSVRRVERHIARALYGIDRTLEGPPLRWWERLLRL